MAIMDRLGRILAESFGVKVADFAPDARLEALGLDSLALRELLFEVEDEFHIRISGEPDVATLQDVLNLIEQLVAQQGERIAATVS